MLDISIVLKPKLVREEENLGVFEIENLFAGYGITLGNALRRILLSSLPGAAVTQVKIKGVDHEFSTIPNVIEDVVEILLNIKKLRLRLHTDEPQTVVLRAKGETKVTAKDIEKHSQVDVINKDLHIATLTSKKAELEIELRVERGLGYEPIEMRKKEKLPIGAIALDAFFSPVKKVSFVSENMRVGDRTDYNKLKIVIETDGSLTPEDALQRAARILVQHFAIIGGENPEEVVARYAEEVPAAAEAEEEKKPKKSKKKK